MSLSISSHTCARLIGAGLVASGLCLSASAGSQTSAQATPTPAAKSSACPKEMAMVQCFCIDRYEISTVDVKTGEALSPYYPPQPKLLSMVRDFWLLERFRVGTAEARGMPLPELSAWQRSHSYEAKAISRAGVVPQGYLS